MTNEKLNGAFNVDFGNSGQVQLGESPKSHIEGVDIEGALYFVTSYNATGGIFLSNASINLPH